MFSIFDGRKSFYQWDSDRKVIVNDDSIKQVHFCNRTDDCSLVVDTYKDGNLTVANVPNILLQSDLRIIVYAFDSQYTKFSDCFNVIKRTKPADYVYTETEVKTYTLLEERMKELEAAVSVDSIAQAVEDYLKENPVEAGATAAEAAQIAKNTEDIGTLKAEGANYATKEYVDNSVSNVDIPEVPSNISAFNNDSGYQTAAQVESIVDEAIKEIELPTGGGEEWELVADITTTEDVATILVTDEKLKDYKKLYIEAKGYITSAAQNMLNVNGMDSSVYSLGRIGFTSNLYRAMKGYLFKALDGSVAFLGGYLSAGNSDGAWEGQYKAEDYVKFPVTRIKYNANVGALVAGYTFKVWGCK